VVSQVGIDAAAAAFNLNQWIGRKDYNSPA
jgi:hypothetical protein